MTESQTERLLWLLEKLVHETEKAVRLNQSIDEFIRVRDADYASYTEYQLRRARQEAEDMAVVESEYDKAGVSIDEMHRFYAR